MSCKIAHISDIHIRSLSRHDEYRQVFQAFVDDCRSRKVDHIFIGGDVFHTKTTGISPEYIELLTWWLNSMSQVAPVHLTLGNHDGNLANLTRQDSVSPIVEAIGNPQIFLYKKSGMYEFQPGYTFCVFSLFDKEGWKNVKPINGKYNIACYHGPVNCAVTEVGYVLESDITIDMFKEYDLGLLGDIHRQQYLGYRTYNGVEKPWIGYSGSCIQQNYGELVDHGYLLWEISDRNHDVSFIKLPNPKPYITVDWTNDFSNVSVPQNSRVRIKHDRPLSQSEIKIAIDFFKENFSCCETTFSLNSQQVAVTNKIIDQRISMKDNFHNVDALISLMKVRESGHNFSSDDWLAMYDQVKSYIMLRNSVDDSSHHTKWSLKELKFDNLLGYGEGNLVNFSNLNGIIGIFGPNRVGKSSIIGALSYCLFNGSDRGSIKNLDMINVRKSSAYARAVIDVNGVDYVVERQSVKNQNKKEVTASTAVNLFKINDGEAHDLNGEQRSDTDKAIRNLVGHLDDFMLTSLSTQGDIDRFIKEGSTHRKQILNKFLDLDFFDGLHDLAKSDVNSIKSEVKGLQGVRKIDVQTANSIIQRIEESVSEFQNEKNLVSQTIEDLNLKIRSLSVDESLQKKYDDLKKKVSDQANTIELTQEEINSLNKKIKLEQTELSAKEIELSKIDLANAKEKLEILKSLKTSKVSTEYAIEKADSEVKRRLKSIKVLDDVPCGDKFPKCIFIKDAHSDKVNLPEMQEKLGLLDSEISEISKRIGDLEKSGIENIIKNDESLRTSIKLLTDNINRLEHNLSTKKEKLTYLSSTYHSLNDEYQNLSQRIDLSSSLDLLDLNQKLSIERKKLTEVDLRLSDLFGKKGAVLEQIKQTEEVNKTLLDKLQELKLKEFIMTSFSKKGIPSKVLSDQLPLINMEISQILAGIVDFTVELECNDASSLDVFINYGDSRRAIELCSGMEKMISSVAIRAALISVSTIPKSDFLVIDEGFGALDEAGIDSCKRLLMSMKRFFKSILIISHIPAIKDVADTIIELQKAEKDSRVFYA